MQDQQETHVNIYGDSIMRGTVIDEKTQRYRTVVGQLLERLSKQFRLCFKSRAHFGCTVQRGNSLLEKDLQKGLGCQYALVEYGGNDCSFNWDEVAAAPQKEHKPLTPLDKYEGTLLTMTTQLQQQGVTPVLMTLPPVDAERHLNFIGKDEKARKNILEWLGDVQMIYRFHELYSRTIEKIAQQTSSILVDVRHRFLDRHDLRRLIGMDGVHLSQEGYGLVCETFADFIGQRRQSPGRLVFE